jgi:hypothetical protein
MAIEKKGSKFVVRICSLSSKVNMPAKQTVWLEQMPEISNQ